MHEVPSCILLGGPTASGKTASAITLAQLLGGEIVNIDTVQCYRGLAIGSAKPSPEEFSKVPHHLFDIYDPDVQIDVAQFSHLVRATVVSIRERSKTPILVGSSGMYISVLYSGIANVPAPAEELRAWIRSRSTEELYTELQRLDAERSSELHPSDRQRIERAVEICHVTGGTVRDAYRNHLPPFVKGPLFVLFPSPAQTAQRILARTEKMLEAGLVEETEAIRLKWGDGVPPLQTIGYRQVLDQNYQYGSDGRDSLVTEIATKTRHYAKRQRTFWRNEPRKRGWPTSVLPVELTQEAVAETICLVLKDNPELINTTSVFYLQDSPQHQP